MRLKHILFFSLFVLIGIFFCNGVFGALNDNVSIAYTIDDDTISGSTLEDLSPNGNDGTIDGATSGVTGIINETLDFDGINDYVDIPAFTVIAMIVGVVLK